MGCDWCHPENLALPAQHSCVSHYPHDLRGPAGLPATEVYYCRLHNLMPESPADRGFEVGGVCQAELTLYEEMP